MKKEKKSIKCLIITVLILVIFIILSVAYINRNLVIRRDDHIFIRKFIHEIASNENLNDYCKNNNILIQDIRFSYSTATFLLKLYTIGDLSHASFEQIVSYIKRIFDTMPDKIQTPIKLVYHKSEETTWEMVINRTN